MYYVYILWSDRASRYYIGQTSHMEKRLIRHNSGWEKSTRNYRPWIIVWSVQLNTRSEAMKLERKLKNLSKSRLTNFINGG